MSTEDRNQRRKEHTACVRTGRHENGKPTTLAWCGRETGHKWAFTDACHASLNTGRMTICRDCARRIVKAIADQT